MSKNETPQEVAPSTLWAMYTKVPVPHELVDLPVGEKFPLVVGALPQIAMVPLTAEETMLCRAEADDFTRRTMLKSPPKDGEQQIAYRSIYDDDVTLRVIWRASRDPSDPQLRKKVFPGPKPMREVFTLDQIGVLAHAYVRVERMLSPIRYFMSRDEMDGLLLRLREGGRETAPLDYLSSGLLRDLLMHSVSNPPPSSSASTSPGGPPDSSETTSGSEPAPEEPPAGTLPSEPESTGGAPGEAGLSGKLIRG